MLCFVKLPIEMYTTAPQYEVGLHSLYGYTHCLEQCKRFVGFTTKHTAFLGNGGFVSSIASTGISYGLALRSGSGSTGL